MVDIFLDGTPKSSGFQSVVEVVFVFHIFVCSLRNRRASISVKTKAMTVASPRWCLRVAGPELFWLEEYTLFQRGLNQKSATWLVQKGKVSTR